LSQLKGTKEESALVHQRGGGEGKGPDMIGAEQGKNFYKSQLKEEKSPRSSKEGVQKGG